MPASIDAAAIPALFLPYPLPWDFLPFGAASSPMVMMLANPFALASIVQAVSKELAEGRLQLTFSANRTPLGPYLAS